MIGVNERWSVDAIAAFPTDRKRDQLTDGDDAAVVSGCPALNIAYLIGETKTLAWRFGRKNPRNKGA